MKLLGPTTVRGFYPATTREDAVFIVQRSLFSYSNGIVGSAIYLYKTQERAFECAEWIVECEAALRNAAEVSVESGEFYELFRYGKPDNSNMVYNHNEWQRHVVLWSGYDGLILDCGFAAVYGNTACVKAIKAYPKINDNSKEQSYNGLWSKLKRVSGIFKKD